MSTQKNIDYIGTAKNWNESSDSKRKRLLKQVGSSNNSLSARVFAYLPKQVREDLAEHYSLSAASINKFTKHTHIPVATTFGIDLASGPDQTAFKQIVN